MSELYGIVVEHDRPGEAILEVTAVHPDAGALPFPGHRPVWACALLSALRYTWEDMTAGLVWQVADTIAAVRLLEVRDYPRTSSIDKPDGPMPTMRVRIVLVDDRRLFDFTSELDDAAFRRDCAERARIGGWGADVSSRDGAAQARLPRVKGPLATSVDPPAARIAELGRTGRHGRWDDVLPELVSLQTAGDVVPILLDHAGQPATLAAAAVVADQRLDDAVAIALGDPTLASTAAIVVGLAGPAASGHARSVLARAIAAHASKRSAFRARATQLVGAHLAWAGIRVLGDPSCERMLARLPNRGAALRAALALAPTRRAEIVDGWPGADELLAAELARDKTTRTRTTPKPKPKPRPKPRSRPARRGS